MNFTNFKKLLNLIVVVGKTQSTFFKKSKPFELKIYYTPVKNKIMHITIEGVEIENKMLFITFEEGQDVSLVFDWIEKNGHQITFQRNRI